MTAEMWIWQVVEYLILVSAAVIVFVAVGKAFLHLLDRANHEAIESSMQNLLHHEDRLRRYTIDDLHKGLITEEGAKRKLAASNRRSSAAEAEHKLAIRGLTGKW